MSAMEEAVAMEALPSDAEQQSDAATEAVETVEAGEDGEAHTCMRRRRSGGRHARGLSRRRGKKSWILCRGGAPNMCSNSVKRNETVFTL